MVRFLVRVIGAAMPISQLVFFAGWLVAALIGGAALVYVWTRWTGRSGFD
jgi:hypothetical protein